MPTTRAVSDGEASQKRRFCGARRPSALSRPDAILSSISLSFAIQGFRPLRLGLVPPRRDRHRLSSGTTVKSSAFCSCVKPTQKIPYPHHRTRNVHVECHRCFGTSKRCVGARIHCVADEVCTSVEYCYGAAACTALRIIRLGCAHARQSIARAYLSKPRTPEGPWLISHALFLRGQLHLRVGDKGD